ncbi:MAG: hypothetical protein BGN86_16215 [Caulobacterales bacterium 68-7]|nr:MAG: hypothetical protein BGN86_16215 [Caulobacterales bacterium 68-7]
MTVSERTLWRELRKLELHIRRQAPSAATSPTSRNMRPALSSKSTARGTISTKPSFTTLSVTLGWRRKAIGSFAFAMAMR